MLSADYSKMFVLPDITNITKNRLVQPVNSKWKLLLYYLQFTDGEMISKQIVKK